jgi:hypothetical protein
LIGKTDRSFFEQSHEFRICPLHFDHPHAFYLLGPRPIDRRLQYACKLRRNQQGQGQTYHESSGPKSAKQERAQPNRNEQRPPNLAVAERRHEHVERRARPSFVDEMKQDLVHVME